MSDLDAILRDVSESGKYRHLTTETVRRVAERELANHKCRKEALHATRAALHQAAAAYFSSKPRYAEWLRTLREAQERGLETDWRETCHKILRSHASSAERLPFLEAFYATLLAPLQKERPIRTVLDVACGLNPLALPFMGLGSGTAYFACDLYADLALFLNGFFEIANVSGKAFCRDLLAPGASALPQADVAFVFKLLPLLDQWDKRIAATLLREIPAPNLLISFPTRSLGGRGKGMERHYSERFSALCAEETWRIERFDFPNELCFWVKR